MRFCFHRWSIVKRFTRAEEFFAIARCRKCESWEVREMDVSNEGLRISPRMQRRRIKMDEPLILNTPNSSVNPTESD